MDTYNFDQIVQLSDSQNIDNWKAEVIFLLVKEVCYSLTEALEAVEEIFDSISGDIETNSPRDVVDNEISEMRTNCC